MNYLFIMFHSPLLYSPALETLPAINVQQPSAQPWAQQQQRPLVANGIRLMHCVSYVNELCSAVCGIPPSPDSLTDEMLLLEEKFCRGPRVLSTGVMSYAVMY